MPCHDSCGALLLQLAIYGLANGAVVALNAVGFSLSYAVARQMNLAHGGIFALTTVLVSQAAFRLGIADDAPAAVRVAALALLAVGGALAGAALNLLVERLAFRPFFPVRSSLGPLIASVGLSFVLYQAIFWTWTLLPSVSATERAGHQGVNVALRAMPALLPDVELAGNGVSFTLRDLLVLLLAALVMVGGALLLGHSRLGRQLRAASQDAELLALVGGDPRAAQTRAFGVAGALAGLAATVFATYHGGATASLGIRSGLDAVAAAVVGGVGSPVGALLGGVGLGVLAPYSDYFLDATWTPVLVLLLLVAFLAIRPSGLLGQPATAVDAPPPAPAQAAASPSARPARLPWALLALGLVYPWLDQWAGWQRLYGATAALHLVTLAVGLSIVVSFAGLLDLGYAAFYAIGAYTTALLAGSGGRLQAVLPSLATDPLLALAAAGVVAGCFGLLFGLPSVRTRGEYLAIVTLALGEIVPGVIVHLDWLGASRGLSGVAAVRIGPWPAGSPLHAYALALGAAVLAWVVASRLRSSRVGRAWGAVREDETAAAAGGVPPTGFKLRAFVVGAAFAGVVGGLLAGQLGHVEPSQFDFTLSLMVLAAVVSGARWGLAGTVVAALLVAAYDRLLVDALDAGLRLGGIQASLRDQNFAVFGLALYAACVLPMLRRPATFAGRPP